MSALQARAARARKVVAYVWHRIGPYTIMEPIFPCEGPQYRRMRMRGFLNPRCTPPNA